MWFLEVINKQKVEGCVMLICCMMSDYLASEASATSQALGYSLLEAEKPCSMSTYSSHRSPR